MSGHKQGINGCRIPGISAYPVFFTTGTKKPEKGILCAILRENIDNGIGNRERSAMLVGRKEGCEMVKRICNMLAALALLMTPVAAGACRSYFYEEKEPDGLQEFVTKKSKHMK